MGSHYYGKGNILTYKVKWSEEVERGFVLRSLFYIE